MRPLPCSPFFKTGRVSSVAGLTTCFGYERSIPASETPQKSSLSGLDAPQQAILPQNASIEGRFLLLLLRKRPCLPPPYPCVSIRCGLCPRYFKKDSALL